MNDKTKEENTPTKDPQLEPEISSEKALQFALEQDLESVVILGKRRPGFDKTKHNDPFFMFTCGEYDYPPLCYWVLSIAMDVVKEITRENAAKQNKGVIISPHKH